MPSASDSSVVADMLALKKKIDAICDRFEKNWEHAQKPRIEDYLSELPQDNRASLFRELLASELALRGALDSQASYSDYLGRFPEYRDCVLDAFANKSTLRVSADDALPRQARKSLIEKTQLRLRQLDSPAIAGHDPRPNGVETECRPGVPTAMLQRQSDQLWDLLIRRARITDASGALLDDELANIALLEAVTQRVLDALPTSRRSMLIQLLLGHSIEQTARSLEASERTVHATLQAALEMLARPSSH